MLETEEVDDDFFTPIASTSLASIFGNVSKNKDSNENSSLKYVPPKPQNIVPKKKEPPKATECVFACALIGHEWCNNVYTSRGKLGFAIVKIQNTDIHNIILYDSNKITLSSVPISSKLEVTIKNNSYISYYDSLQKYWSIYGTEDEIKKIAEILNSIGANINYSEYAEKGPLEPNNAEIETHATLEDREQKPNRESDTDSSVNRKTKASILNRMANMGHSVLPTRAPPVERTSDSDTDEIEAQPKAVRHKTIKTSIKRNSIENIVSEPRQVTETHQRIILNKPEPETNVTVYNSQLLPLANTGVIANTSNEFGMFMSEQRISNSELRININRITDKVDSVLNKINSLDHKGNNANPSTDILYKLLTEYENKIKIYEELLKSRGIDDKKVIEDRFTYSNKDKDLQLLNSKVNELEKINEDQCKEIKNLQEEIHVLKEKHSQEYQNHACEIQNINEAKDDEICKLQQEIRILKEKHAQETQNQTGKELDLLTKINDLESALQIKNTELTDLTKNISTSTDHSNDNIGDKVKNIMNNTFQTISMNFEDSDVYTGETIKRTVGAVIKKITINTLSEMKHN